MSINNKGRLDISTIQFVLNHIDSPSSSPITTTISPSTTTISNKESNRWTSKDSDEEDEQEENVKESDDEEYHSGDENPKKDEYEEGSNLSSPSSSSTTSNLSWLDQLSICISSDGTMMVMGGGGSGGIGTGLAVVLQKRPTDENWKTSTTLDHQSQTVDKITQIVLVPLYVAQLDYVIAIGYTSGYLRIFSTHGNLLLSQLFHRSPIQKIKVKTSPIISSNTERFVTQELSILYPNNVVASMSGVSLSTVLQVCYSQILRGDSTSQAQANLDFRKWSLGSVECARDFVFCGPFLGSPFRALPYGTTENSVVRLVAVGKDPILSFYYPSDDGGTSFSVAVALVSSVAAKLTSAVYSFAKNWWGGSSPQQQQQQQQQQQPGDTQKIENPLPLSIRWSIMDEKRILHSIILDPTGRYAATTDNLGRVLLVDVVNSIIVKVWKGYRDCQCAWIQSVENEEAEETQEEDDWDNWEAANDSQTLEDLVPPKLLKSNQTNSKVNYRSYLAIYIGRRGCLEVWGMKHKQRVLFQKVGLGCKLIYSSVPSKLTNNPNTNNKQSQFYSTIENFQSNCFLITASGQIQEIKI